MQVQNFIVKENEFNGHKYLSLYIIIDKKEYLMGTIKQKENINYINFIHKDYKKN